MKLIFLGLPGSGKGTQAELLAKEFGFKLIATGDMLRKAITEKTSLGEQAYSYVKNGALVPDEIVLQLVQENIKGHDNFILDGFPRTLEQAKSLSRIINIEKVFYFNCPTDVIVERLSNRRICPKCAKVYNLITNSPKKAELCDNCSTKLILREDDNPSVVRKRIEVYKAQTMNLLDFYKNVLIKIDVSSSVEEVYTELKCQIKKQ